MKTTLKDSMRVSSSPGVISSRVPRHPAYGSLQGGLNQTQARGLYLEADDAQFISARRLVLRSGLLRAAASRARPFAQWRSALIWPSMS